MTLQPDHIGRCEPCGAPRVFVVPRTSVASILRAFLLFVLLPASIAGGIVEASDGGAGAQIVSVFAGLCAVGFFVWLAGTLKDDRGAQSVCETCGAYVGQAATRPADAAAFAARHGYVDPERAP